MGVHRSIEARVDESCQKHTSAHQYRTRHKARSLVHRSSSISKHVPSGCPPPKMTSKSRSPTDVNVTPPVQAFVPLGPAIDGASERFRRNDDDMATVELKVEQSYLSLPSS